MNLDQARFHVGDGVVYQPHPGAPGEDGDITSVRDRYVMVRYVGDRAPKATRAEQIRLLVPCPSCVDESAHRHPGRDS